MLTDCSINTNTDDEESTAGTATSAAPTPAPSDGGPNPELIWPSMQDLNTRLRRVITSYQRNYKKEELKQQQKAKVSFFFSELKEGSRSSSYQTTIHSLVPFCIHNFA